MGDGLLDLPAAGQRQPEMVLGRRVIGQHCQGLTKTGDGLVNLPAVGQGDAEAGVGVQVAGLDFQGLAVMIDGFLDLSAPAKASPRLVWAG